MEGKHRERGVSELTTDQVAYCHELAQQRREMWAAHKTIRDAAIEECAKIAADRAVRLRTKAKSMKTPHSQHYFAQAIEARVIADCILGLLNPPKQS